MIVTCGSLLEDCLLSALAPALRSFGAVSELEACAWKSFLHKHPHRDNAKESLNGAHPGWHSSQPRQMN